MRITVFTPTYNRAYSLPRLFESLKIQTFFDFEWVIVDDGSSDNTEEVVNGFIEEKPYFKIKYKKTENGGKHRAINRGLDLAEGELFFIVDSDDWLPCGSLSDIDETEKSIPGEQKIDFAGVCGLKCFGDEKIIGSTFWGEYLDLSTLEKRKYSISGDRAEVYYTSILKRYPFPEIEGEKFVTESIVWDRISHDGYKLRYFNKNVYLCEYLKDGLTNQGIRLYANNPVQWAMSIAQDREFGKTKGYGLSIQYYKFFLLEKRKYSKSRMSELLNTSLGKFSAFISVQLILDFCRGILGKTRISDEFKK